MVATRIPTSLKQVILPALFVLAGIGVAAGIATAPSETLNEALARSSVAAVIPAAGPPIGLTGRALLALFVGGLIAAIGVAGHLKAWVAGAPTQADEPGEAAPVVRRADAHPDAPPRRPIRASADLGQPLPIGAERPRATSDVLPFALEPRAADDERALPDDLDQPMSAFDPAALPPVPVAAPEPVVALYRAPAREAAPATPNPAPAVVVEVPAPPAAPSPPLTPVEVEPAGEAAARVLPTALPGAPLTVATVAADEETPDHDDSIAGLLARLEQGARRRQAAEVAHVAGDAPASASPESLDDTLRNLRRLAKR